MTIDIQALVEQRPHLKDPLELYAGWQRFQNKMSQLLRQEGSSLSPSDSRAYPRDSVGPAMQLFASIFDLPGEELAPLGQALEDGNIDFMRLPLDEIPDLSLPYAERELASILFLLGRPYFLALREACLLDGRQWEDGRCPLCSARPALTSIAEGPRRRLHCSYCGTVGPYRFMGCPNCGSTDTTKLSTLVPEGEPGFRVVTCDACRTYVKVMEGSLLDEMTADLADMASLPLDIVAQEKGYVRRAPNPIGLKMME